MDEDIFIDIVLYVCLGLLLIMGLRYWWKKKNS